MSTVIKIKFKFSSDLAIAKEQIKEYIKELNDVVDKPNNKIRVLQAADLIDAYITATEQRPDDYQLYALGSYILDDYLRDQYKHLRDEEHPFQTDARVRKNHARHQTKFLGNRTDV